MKTRYAFATALFFFSAACSSSPSSSEVAGTIVHDYETASGTGGVWKGRRDAPRRHRRRR